MGKYRYIQMYISLVQGFRIRFL